MKSCLTYFNDKPSKSANTLQYDFGSKVKEIEERIINIFDHQYDIAEEMKNTTECSILLIKSVNNIEQIINRMLNNYAKLKEKIKTFKGIQEENNGVVNELEVNK